MPAFSGFTPSVARWFTGLEADNSKQYFAANRDTFDREIKGQMEALLHELSETFGGEVKLFRQNRDVRFSADKSPYKTNTYGVLHGDAIPGAGLYASISAEHLAAGGGYYEMARDQLDRFRERIADPRTGPALAQLVDDARAAGLELWVQTLVTAPRGYDRDHPRIELLRLKSLALGATLPAAKGVSRDEALNFVTTTWRGCIPIATWLREHVGPSTLPVERRRGR
jgi:uncharacterized protein (TIGR02453 family)